MGNDNSNKMERPMSRKSRGYLWGKEQLECIGEYHYERAIKSDNLGDEEVAYQRVFHKTHSEELAKECFQEERRNKLSTSSHYNQEYVVSEADKTAIGRKSVSSCDDDEWVKHDWKYIVSQNTGCAPDSETIALINVFFESMVQNLTERQMYVLAYITVMDYRLDDMILEYGSDELDGLAEMIRELYREQCFSKGQLYSKLGKRYQVEKDWTLLTDKARKLMEG